MQLRSRKSRSARVPSLLELPDAVVELVAAHLPPRCMAQLQTTCKHMQQLLGHDRLWEVQLTDNNQEWAAAGIVPVSGRKQGQTWKELVETACKLESWMPEHLPAFAHTLDFTTAPYSKLHALECVREMWNAGKPTVHIDFCLCCVTARDWSSGALPMTFKLAYLRVLLDVVYFFWYDERQLARGAIFLRKALLAILSLPHEDERDSSGYDMTQLGMLVPSAGAFLMDLLHMKTLQSSPMSMDDPAQFMQACQGHEVAVEQAHSSSSDTFKWCGTEYSCADLKAATDLLMHSDNQSQSEDVAQPSTDPWDVASFKVFIPDAVQLLNALADRRALPEEEWQMPGSILLQQAAQNAEFSDAVSNVGRCRAHQLFAGATLCFRLHDRLDRCMTAHAEHGLMYEDARQHHRAAYYYKLAVLTGVHHPGAASTANLDSVLIGIAEAYDGAWQESDINCPKGTKESYQQAFAWRKYVVHHVLHKPNKTQHECERTCECLHSLGLLLEDHSCRGASIPELDSYDTHLLAVGAYMTGLRQFDANAGVISWICSHVEMADAAEESFSTFLNSKPVNQAPDTAAVLDSSSSLQASQHPSASQASPDPTQPTPSSSAGPQPPPKSNMHSEATVPGPSTAPSSAASGHLSTSGQANGKQSEIAQGAAAPPVLAPPPAELTVKHVGFLGSLAHALVHLQKSAEGLSLLRAAAHVMRHSPPNGMYNGFFHQNAPDSKVLHAHVLMDLGVSLLGERQYEEALSVFMEGLGIAQKEALGERVLSTFHDHVAHTILQLRQQRACHQFLLSNGRRVDISWKKAQQHAEQAVAAGQRCKPYEAALEASPLTTLGDIASAMCLFNVAKSRYMEAFNKLAGDEEQRAALSPSNAAEAATTMAAVADMLLKLGQVDEAAASLDQSLQLLEQFPCQLPALQIKRTELYLTTLQMQIHIFRNDLVGAHQKLKLCIGLTQQGAEYRPGFVRYDEALTQAAEGNMQTARQHFEAASVVAEEQQDRQLETMACTALGLLLTSRHFPDKKDQQTGWQYLQRGLELAARVGDMLCEVHAAEGMLKVLQSGSLGRTLKNRRELKRSLQDKVQAIVKEVGQPIIESSCKMLSFAGL